MKYKVLVTGSNESIIDDFFVHMSETFETQFCSSRVEDIVTHIKYFSPDVFICCLAKEGTTFRNHMISVKLDLEKYNIPLVIIGAEEECEEFATFDKSLVDLKLCRPIAPAKIVSEISRFMAGISKKKVEDSVDIMSIEEERELLEFEQLQREIEESMRETDNARKHILVVDDDSRMLKLIKGYLAGDYDVAVAINGKVALKFLENNHTDLVLLDYEMPGEKGPEVLEKIRDNPKLKNLPVIFLTGVKDKDKVEECLKLKPEGYLLKPIVGTRLLNKVKNTLYKK